MTGTYLTPEHALWLKQFEADHQRKLRVLHIGNIAANGFLNAKFMRRVGIEADVLCYDYYHIMGYPEWEELAINDDYRQDIYPRFSYKDRLGYRRPRWFVQGPLSICFAYLTAKNEGKVLLANYLWRKLNEFLFSRSFIFYFYIKPAYLSYNVIFYKEIIKKYLYPFYSVIRKLPVVGHYLAGIRPLIGRFTGRIKPEKPTTNSLQFIEELNAAYKTAFPNRKFTFTENDLNNYFANQHKWEELFKHYDVIQCYATDPIYGLLFANKPYVAFEHGTLRTFTSDTSRLNALTALAYRQAYHAFITNGDCLAYAQELNMTNFSPMIHPVDVEQHRQIQPQKIKNLRKHYQADVLLFCPLRHDWDIKGTDRHIRALPLLNQTLTKRIILVMTNWGKDLKRSQQLATELNVSEQIIWSKPLSRPKMIEMLQACDVVLDQTILPCFGSTSPQALACGTPTLMSYDPATTAWLIPEPAPIIQARNEEEIVNGIKMALNPQWLKDFKQRATDWIDTYHSTSVALNQHVAIYKKMLQFV